MTLCDTIEDIKSKIADISLKALWGKTAEELVKEIIEETK